MTCQHEHDPLHTSHSVLSQSSSKKKPPEKMLMLEHQNTVPKVEPIRKREGRGKQDKMQSVAFPECAFMHCSPDRVTCFSFPRSKSWGRVPNSTLQSYSHPCVDHQSPCLGLCFLLCGSHAQHLLPSLKGNKHILDKSNADLQGPNPISFSRK